jgi:hypothetical protein
MIHDFLDELQGHPFAAPSGWVFEDRLPAELAPAFRPDIVRFYESDGPTLSEIVPRSSAIRIDESVVSELVELLRRINASTGDKAHRKMIHLMQSQV